MVIVIGVVLLLVLPVVLFVVQRSRMNISSGDLWPLPKATQTPSRYSAASEVPGYTLQITDTRFLDYVVDNTGIFKPEGVIDPESYQGGMNTRHTVTRIKLAIVPLISHLLVAVPGQKDMAAYGDYTVEGDTLVLRVQFNQSEAASLGASRHGLEDAFLQAALQTVEYAHGLSSDPRATLEVFRQVKEGISQYLYNNVVPWPIQITQR